MVNLGEKIQEESDTENKFALKLHVHIKIGLRNLYRRGPRLHFECRANAVVIFD